MTLDELRELAEAMTRDGIPTTAGKAQESADGALMALLSAGLVEIVVVNGETSFRKTVYGASLNRAAWTAAVEACSAPGQS